VKGTAKIVGSEALTKCCVCMEDVSSKDTVECNSETQTYHCIYLYDLFISAHDSTSLVSPHCCSYGYVSIYIKHCPYVPILLLTSKRDLVSVICSILQTILYLEEFDLL
jgi:hypothetical protein